MATPTLRFLSDSERHCIHDKVINVLETVGVRFNTPVATELLAAAGADIDDSRQSARIPRELVDQCCRTVPKDVLLAARDPVWDRHLGPGHDLVCTTDGSATYILDDLTGERREGTAEDLARLVTLFDALPEVEVLWSTISAHNLDPRTAILEILATCFANSSKHLQDGIRQPAFVAPALEIIEAASGATVRERPIFSAINCTIAPLQHDGPMTEASLDLARHGVPIFILPMPLMGTTAPMSIPGTCVVHLAELLSAVVLFQLAAPGCSLVAATTASLADMHSGMYLCGAPEKALINACLVEMARFYGLPTQADGICSDAKAADMQSGAEGMMTGLISVLSEADCLIAQGCFDGAQTTSLAKIMLDCDAIGALRRILRGCAIDPDATLADEIAAVGIGGHYLARRSTRFAVRAGEIWQPSVWRRGPWEATSRSTLIEDAVARAETAIAAHEPRRLSEDVQTYIDQVIRSFAARAG